MFVQQHRPSKPAMFSGSCACMIQVVVIEDLLPNFIYLSSVAPPERQASHDPAAGYVLP